MKKLLLSIYFCISSLSFGQVGINTANPHLSADLELGSTNKSLLLNRVPNTGAIANPVNGMLIYDVAEQCVKAFQGGAWSSCFWQENNSFALTCASAVFAPATATQGQAYTGTLTIPYTGGDGSAYPGQTIQSNGLTATLAPGTFATGAGSLQFSVAGFPITSGSAVFSITVNGSTCTSISLPVNPGTPVIPPNITLEGRYFIASVYDQDYSPFTTPTGPATTARPVAADGVNETLVDLQGVIPTSGLTVYIPATATGSGSIGSFSQTINVPANLTEDGISRNITLSWSSQSYNSTTKSITATLKAEGGTLNARKLDVNAGIGNDYLGVLLGRFLMPNAGAQKGYDVRIIAAIPDRMFNQPDIDKNFSHNFLYLPIQAEDGNVWLNHNLGADYTNVNDPNFNLGKRPTSASDYRAYGSLFQWGRKPDGHDLIKWSASNTGTPVNPIITGTANDNPTDTRFIATGSDWRVTGSTTLWQTSTSANNPCPIGFKVPTQAQIQTYLSASNITNGINGAAASKLGLTAAGTRDAGLGNISTVTTGTSGLYWSSTAGSISSPAAAALQISQFGAPSATFFPSKAQGISVRCIKE
ncbi:fibrobacter succinogenes major paralogous domain-containing protein [Chryseobacterium sp. Bi04]|uniref:fibrobacter succinogenes major paralogous domain-containing protein n=1 Tax=Chryseobacterium sp. Bi04 TaxID=2822345 RepID=UPI001DDB479B|nr:fibrobacter succinogenes major paralogous domain-containing protein [Chryseobacterium sp. Bi04]CAH0134319.1 hypothetical protein SRABI04_00373 [Chryseobacterium sp. Bi04]